jgi:proteasome accessory factor B
MRYHPISSGRVKDYLVEPYRLVCGQGGLYLFAFVPEYLQMRTFAVERIKKLSLLDERFDPVETTPAKPFPHSIGIHSGKPEPVEIEFAPGVAPYIQEHKIHPTQKIRERPDGSLVLSLKVCAAWALQSWVLSFGPFARVLKPAALAERVLAELEQAREQYTPRLSFEERQVLFDETAQRTFPFLDPPLPAR